MNINQVPLRTPVFTTKFVLNENSAILSVICDEDGFWQFMGKEEAEIEDGMIVSLNEILIHDPTLKDIPELFVGTKAIREKVGAKWTVNSL